MAKKKKKHSKKSNSSVAGEQLKKMDSNKKQIRKSNGNKSRYRSKSELINKLKSMEEQGARESMEAAKMFRGSAALVGAAIGMIKTVSDSDDDNIGSTAVNVGIGAAAGYGVARGTGWLAGNDKTGKYIRESINSIKHKSITVGEVSKPLDDEVSSQHMNKTVTAGKDTKPLDDEVSSHSMYKDLTHKDLVKVESEVETKKMLERKAFAKKMENFHSKATVVAAIGATAAIGVASILDVSNDLKHKTREDRMLAYQEENLERQKQQRKKQNKKASYNNVDFGQIAIDMFNERTGHYKMGNSKFQ